ncbi:MAG TPA: nitrous oxide reductase accessory protein NosL [Blastocatellia bacterium]|nr:nitrous oxide reductase accessory protein NosL [Blastocatellia bacterium]
MENREKTFKIQTPNALALAFLVSIILSSCGPSRGAVTSEAAFGYCPVCRMKVKASDPWAAEIYYTDRTKVMFESPGDMLAFYTSPQGYQVDDVHKDRANIERIVVKDYQSKQPTDAYQAVFIYKSQITGPMGADFLPFAKKEDAEAFVATSAGTILSLNEVTGDMARDLRK